jgi:hypothetical protein
VKVDVVTCLLRNQQMCRAAPSSAQWDSRGVHHWNDWILQLRYRIMHARTRVDICARRRLQLKQHFLRSATFCTAAGAHFVAHHWHLQCSPFGVCAIPLCGSGSHSHFCSWS